MFKKMWFVVAVALLVMASLAGCAVGDVAAPETEVPISIDAALEGQNAGMAGLMSGAVTWTDSQFSSFLTELLRQNTGPNQPVDSITAWFAPGGEIHLRIALKDGVLLGGKNIDAAGTVGIENGTVMVNITAVGANGVMTEDPMILGIVNSYINSTLSGFGVAATLETGDGEIMIGMAQ